MRVLIFATLAIAAASGYTLCAPNTNYIAVPQEIYGGGVCYCDDKDGSTANCTTTYLGVKFTFTQNLKERRGNLKVCVPEGRCHVVPQSTNLNTENLNCDRTLSPVSCSFVHDELNYSFVKSEDNKVQNMTVVFNGETHPVHPKMVPHFPSGFHLEW